jgi:hypothetical protein
VGEGSDCHVYDLVSGGETVTYSGHHDIVLATAISPDGRWAATGGGGNNEIHLWELATGKRRLGPGGQPLTLGGQGRPARAAGFSADGTRIGWGNTDRGTVNSRTEPFEHEFALPSAADVLPRPRPIAAADSGGFRRALAQQGAWSLEHRKGGNYGFDAVPDIWEGGKVIGSIERGSTDGYDHRSYSCTPDGETIISGGLNGVLTAYDRVGNKLPNGDFIGQEGVVWAVAPSPDGRFLLSGAADQTLRLWNLKTRELLVTLFHGADGEWVMWTPQGYYIASLDGDKHIGWQINRGPDKEARYIRAAQLAEQLRRPGIVARTVALGSAKAAIAEAGESLDIGPLLGVPEFYILLPMDGEAQTEPLASIVVAAEARPDPQERYAISVNSRNQPRTRDMRFTTPRRTARAMKRFMCRWSRATIPFASPRATASAPPSANCGCASTGRAI